MKIVEKEIDLFFCFQENDTTTISIHLGKTKKYLYKNSTGPICESDIFVSIHRINYGKTNNTSGIIPQRVPRKKRGKASTNRWDSLPPET